MCFQIAGAAEAFMAHLEGFDKTGSFRNIIIMYCYQRFKKTVDGATVEKLGRTPLCHFDVINQGLPG